MCAGCVADADQQDRAGDQATTKQDRNQTLHEDHEISAEALGRGYIAEGSEQPKSGRWSLCWGRFESLR